MSAPRLTVRIQLQQDHGFSRPLFHKPRRRRWPWLLLVLVMAAGATLYLQPQLVQQWSPASTAGQGVTTQLPAVTVTTASSPSPVAGSVEAITLEPSAEVVVEAATPTPAEAEQPALAASEATTQPQPVAVEPAEPVVSAAEPMAAAVAPVAVATAEPETMAVAVEQEAAHAPQPLSNQQEAAALGNQSPAGSAQPAPTVARALLAANIAEREPVAVIDTQSPLRLDAPTALFYFTELRDLNGKRVAHRWYHNGTLVKERTIDVGAIRWRTWSRHVLDELSGGDWKVELIDSQGAVLAENSWQVAVSAPTPTP